MSTHDEGLSAREHDEMRDLVLAGTQRIRPAGSHRAQFVAVGVSLILVGAVTGGVITAALHDDGSADPVATPNPNPAATAENGWIAYDTGWPKEEIYFIEPGLDPHVVIESDDISRGQVCPAFSSDGARLASGQGGYGQQMPKDGALVISDLTAEGEVASSEVIPLDGLRQQPCPIWSPDGRWVAFGVGSELNTHTNADGVAAGVWVFNTETDEVRRLKGLWVTDIEWAADSSQLYIADADGILLYSIADDQTRRLDDSDGATALAASPDGRSLAVERKRSTSTVIPEQFDLLLMTVDGADRRVLVEDYAHDRGIGPVWSPDGNRIVFQGGADVPTIIQGGETYTMGQNDEVVIVVVGDDDPLGPIGTQKVLAPVRTTDGDVTREWLPATVSWAPDSTALRFVGWELLTWETDPRAALLTVPIDGTAAPTLLWEGRDPGPVTSPPRNDFQSWSRR